MDCKKIGKYIKDKRKSLGYKQSDLGEMLSVSDKAVSKWECGVALPDVSLLPELAKILNVNIEEILNGEDNPKIEEEIKKKNKSKICLITLSVISSILFVLVIILGIFFINNYDKVHVYKLKGEKDSFRVEGNLISVGNNQYLNIHDISFNGSFEHKINCIRYEVIYDDTVLVKGNLNNQKGNVSDLFNNVVFYATFSSDVGNNDFFVLKLLFELDNDETFYNSIFLKIYE